MEGKMFLGQYLTWMMLLLGHVHGYRRCIEKEKKALLEIKKSMLSRTEEGSFDYVLPTWTNDTDRDCCLWEGIECDRTTGRVIKLSFPNFHLNESSLLNLSLLHPFEEVRRLDLSSSLFNGFFDDVKGYKSLKRFKNLKILDLSNNNIDNSIFPFLNAATSLTTLFLNSTNMYGPLQVIEFRDLTNLELLDLSKNRFNGSIPIHEFTALRKLKALGLSNNNFSGLTELHGVFKLKNIEELDLSKNQLVGQFPICITSFSRLRVLDLSSNQLSGNVPSTISNLESLEFLSLVDNNFEDFFSLGSLANLSNLKVLRLDSYPYARSGELEISWKPKFQLSVISLGSCNLEEVPHFLLYQKDLRYVDLSYNKLSGKFPSWLLENNTKLEILLLQNNSFRSFQLPKYDHNLLWLDVSFNGFDQLFPQNIGWILPHLHYLNVTANGFQGNLPFSLGNMKMIEFLDISHNSFHGEIPRSFVMGCYSLRVLKLSHNKLSGEIFQEAPNFTGIWDLYMDNNLFSGKIGKGLLNLTSLVLLDVSNNNLTGVIPSWFDELQDLYSLEISNNLLEGEIPTSLFNLSSLMLLDLSANSLSGNIPQVNSGYGRVEVVLLQDNNLSGVIPETLLESVIVLDLRNNRLSGNLPEFIKSQYISILLLRGNILTGRIPHCFCALRNIHLLDLANNKLNGSIPSCLSNASFGLGTLDTLSEYIYQQSATGGHLSIFFRSLLVEEMYNFNYKASPQMKIEFATKYRYDAYMGGNLGNLFGLDLSENELSGEIPIELGDLLQLHALNLSHNNFSGLIPESFSGLKNIESLDLSFNRLQGHIPQQLLELNNLEVFNVSFNNLSGIIPQGRQFNTFDMRSYLGNPLLCGQLINISCNTSKAFQEPNDGVNVDESMIDMVSFFWSFVAAYVTILLGILASLSFDSPWSRVWFYIVDAFIHKVRTLFW